MVGSGKRTAKSPDKHKDRRTETYIGDTSNNHKNAYQLLGNRGSMSCLLKVPLSNVSGFLNHLQSLIQ